MKSKKRSNQITAISLSLISVGVVLTLVAVLLLTGVITPRSSANSDASTERAEENSTDTKPSATYGDDIDLCAEGIHYPITIVGKAATCYESGTTDKTICEKCGFTLKGSQETPATNHLNRVVKEICIQSNVGCDFPAFFHCPDCGENFYDTLTGSDLGMPIVNLLGSTDGANLQAKVKMAIEYYGEDQSFEADIMLKFQGQSSYLYPKKNFAITLYKKDSNYEKKQKVTLFEGHKEAKYVLKANYVDASAGRNIIAARLYKQIAETSDADDEISQLDTKGVIDGYPILLYQNGEFLGLYTLNMPRDKWLYDMHDSEDTREAVLFSRKFENSNKLRETLTTESFNLENQLWKLEYASTEDFPKIGTQWVLNSFNNVIRILNSKDDAELKQVLPNFVNIDRTIDVLIYTIFLNCYDNRCKNNVYLTYDGSYWTPSVYDLDATFSLNFDGHNFLENNYSANNIINNGTVLFQKVKKLWWSEMVARYKELRASVLTYENAAAVIDEWFEGIPQVCYTADFAKNPTIPQKKVDHQAQMKQFVIDRLAYLDGYFK